MTREYIYNIHEAADVLSVNRETVRRWMMGGKLSGKSIGGVVLLPRWAVEVLKHQRETRSQNRLARYRQYTRDEVRTSQTACYSIPLLLATMLW